MYCKVLSEVALTRVAVTWNWFHQHKTVPQVSVSRPLAMPRRLYGSDQNRYSYAPERRATFSSRLAFTVDSQDRLAATCWLGSLNLHNIPRGAWASNCTYSTPRRYSSVEPVACVGHTAQTALLSNLSFI